MNRHKKGTVCKNPNGGTWCGPAVITVLTGKRYDIVEKDLLKTENKRRANSGKWNPFTGRRTPNKPIKEITGLRTRSVKDALRSYNYDVLSTYSILMEYGHHTNETFRQWTKRTHGKRGKYWFLIVVTGHFMVVKGNKVWDTYTPVEGSTIKKLRYYKRSKMEGVYIVKRKR